MDFFEAVTSRYTYRGQFQQAPIPQSDVEKMLTAAIAAPIGMKTQTGSYIAITDPKILSQLAEILPRYGTAPLVIIMLTQEKGTSINFEIENYCAAAENLLLAVTALGYATVWTDGALRNSVINDGVRQLLQIPAEKHIRAVLPIGIPTEPGAPIEKATLTQMVTFL